MKRGNKIARDLKKVAAAREAALAHLNKGRAEDGLAPLKSVPPMWWEMYGQEWISKEAK